MITSHITLVRFTLRLLSPGGVTVPGRNRKDETDAVLDRDPWGHPHLPGTTLAGSLRAECRRVLGESWAETTFGRLTEPGATSEGSDEPESDPAHPPVSTVDSVPSRLWVLGTRLVTAAGDLMDGAPATAMRTRTAIDRDRAAARTSTLRREELLLAETRFEVYLQWPGAEASERTELLGAIPGWRPLIGRGVSRGNGLCAVENLRWGELDLARAEDLLTWVSAGGPDLVRAVAVERPPALHVAEPDPVILTSVTATIAGPLHVGNGTHRDQIRADGETTQVSEPLCEQGEYVVPGSALKGVLRSRVEYILRSVVHEQAACCDQRGTHCQDQHGRQCLPCQLFGYGGSDAVRGSVGQRGRLRVLDAGVRTPVTRDRTHVAINRFTGGAEPGLLFTDHVLEAGEFDLIVEVIDELTSEQQRAAQCLLRLALNDVDDGLVGVGRATSRGYGSLDLDLDGASGLVSTARGAGLADRVRGNLPAARGGARMNTSPELPSVTTWADAIEGPLAGATCLWQDLDGIHHEPPTREAPPTHVLWAWTDQTLVRVRLDGNEVFVATLRWPLPAGAGPGVSVIRPLPWAADDKRVAAVRDAGGRQGADVLATRWIVVRDDGLSDVHGDHTAAMGAITFLRPA